MTALQKELVAALRKLRDRASGAVARGEVSREEYRPLIRQATAALDRAEHSMNPHPVIVDELHAHLDPGRS